MTSSLSLRLLITSALSTIIALLATALVLNQLFRNYFEERIHSELDAWVVTLTSQTQLDVDGQLTVGELGDPRFSQPLSGYYWQVTQENGAPVLSASYWAQPLDLEPPAERGKLAFATIVGSDGEVYLTGSWRITLEHEGEARELLVAVAIDQTSVEAPISSFRRSVTMALALLGTFLVLASWFTVRIGLKPLDKVKAEVNLVKTKPGQRLSTDCAAEVAPLVKEVNDLLESQEQAVETARARQHIGPRPENPPHGDARACTRPSVGWRCVDHSRRDRLSSHQHTASGGTRTGKNARSNERASCAVQNWTRFAKIGASLSKTRRWR